MILTKNNILVIAIILVLIYIFYTNFESMQNTGRSGDYMNPRAYQPFIDQQAYNDGFIELPGIAEPPWATKDIAGGQSVYGEFDNPLDPVSMGLNYNMCSPSCCSKQWPVPFALEDNKLVKKGKYVASSYTCNDGWNNSGCVCLEPKQADFLNRRGNNGA